MICHDAAVSFHTQNEAFCQWLLCGENDLSTNYRCRDVRMVVLRASAAYMLDFGWTKSGLGSPITARYTETTRGGQAVL